MSGSRQWTTTELAILRREGRQGAVAMAALLDRTIPSVKRAAARHRISLRPAGCRRGLVLGQPRDVSLRRELRDDLVSGRVSAELVAARMKIDEQATVCPACGMRDARPGTATGWCRVCTLDRLSKVHQQATEEHLAQQRLWASRSSLQRARRLDSSSCDESGEPAADVAPALRPEPRVTPM